MALLAEPTRLAASDVTVMNGGAGTVTMTGAAGTNYFYAGSGQARSRTKLSKRGHCWRPALHTQGRQDGRSRHQHGSEAKE
jgi:hypothetical protein